MTFGRPLGFCGHSKLMLCYVMVPDSKFAKRPKLCAMLDRDLDRLSQVSSSLGQNNLNLNLISGFFGKLFILFKIIKVILSLGKYRYINLYINCTNVKMFVSILL